MIKTILRLGQVVALATMLGISGCQSMQAQTDPLTTIDDIQAVLAEGIQASESKVTKPKPVFPVEVTQALLATPPRSVDVGKNSQKLNRFDIGSDQIGARPFFMGLVDGTDVNMIVHPDVKGKISLTLKNVTVPEVMNAVRELYGYDYKRVANGYMVLPVALKTRIFHVDFLNITRTGASQTRISSGQISGGSSSDESSSSSSSESVSGTVIDTKISSDVWSELEKSLRAFVSADGGRQIIVNRQTGMVIVRAYPEELHAVEGLLQNIHSRIKRQVIIEAKILEVRLNDGFQAGINWSALASPEDGKTLTFGQIGGGRSISTGLSDITGNSGTLDPSALVPVEGTTTSAFGGVFTLSASLGDFSAFIELLETQGTVQTLSSPRVSTTNNQKAVIKVGSDEFFITDVSNTTTGSGDDVTQNPDVTLTPFFSGIALDVTPQIDDFGGITLHVHPAVTDVVEKSKSFVIGGVEQTLPLAFSNVRESDSIIHAKDGQIVIIGGLMQNITREEIASTPLLGDLPFIGAAFRHTQQVSAKTELVILLKSTIIEGEHTWRGELGKLSKSYDLLDRGFHYGGKSEVFGIGAETQ